MEQDLTTGNITGKLFLFALPLMVGNVLQQFYNLVDTWVVGKFIGADALAAVGSSYTLMTFLTSILLGLCMGSSAYFAIQYGKKDFGSLQKGIFLSFLLIGGVAIALNLFVFLNVDWIIKVLQVPEGIREMMREYLVYIFMGILAVFLYNYYANLLRAVGNSFVPLAFLGVSVVLNVILDLIFVVKFQWSVRGTAVATVIAQYIAGIGLFLYYNFNCKELKVERQYMHWDGNILRSICSLSFLTCLQQSVMNFGILMVQGLVNSFGTVVMAAFAAAVKIDTVAYMPVQDFGNAFSTFVAQNYGAGKKERIWKGIKNSVICVFVFCSVASSLVCLFARPLMGIFIRQEQHQVIAVGVEYLRIEAAFYFGIGLLFMLYGYYRAIEKPGMSLVLTICSLGTRVVLAYVLSAIPAVGVTGIWAAIPIGWFLADLVGVGYFIRINKCRSDIRNHN
ncbi:MAG: MATE family efflux transporter [Lachnospiraceae bacterium]